MREITYKNIYCTEVLQNFNKVWRWWGMILRVLMNTGATVRAHGIMYKAAAQTVLLYDNESWVVTRSMLKILEGFHHRAAGLITGMTENVLRTSSRNILRLWRQ